VFNYFFQVPKDWEVELETLGDMFFLFLSKIIDLEALLGTLEMLTTFIYSFSLVHLHQQDFLLSFTLDW
jgi:hypothetical protein